LAFKLLVTLQIYRAKTDGELQVLAVDAAIGAYFARADAEHTFPLGRLLRLEPTRIIYQCSLYEGAASTRYTLHDFTSHKIEHANIL
jgi:hypothetical protein